MYQEPTPTDMSRKWATTVTSRVLIQSSARDNIRSMLPGLRRLLQWSKAFFSDKNNFCISFGNQGPGF